MTLVNKIKNTIIPTALITTGAYLSTGCGPSAQMKEDLRVADSLRIADSTEIAKAELQRIDDSITVAAERADTTFQSKEPASAKKADTLTYTSTYIGRYPKVIPAARVVWINPASMHLAYNNDGNATNEYDYQMVTFNVWTNESQKEIISLATKQTLPLVPGASYKVFYRPTRPGRVLTEWALYFYSINNVQDAKENQSKNQIVYNRKLSGIQGIIDSVRLIK